MQRPGNLVILFQPGAATENLWQPELTNGTLHVANLALCWRGSFDPLRRLPANAANHVGMGEGLWSALLSLVGKGRRNWLSDPRVERRGTAGNYKAAVEVLAGDRAVAGPRPCQGGRCSE